MQEFIVLSDDDDDEAPPAKPLANEMNGNGHHHLPRTNGSGPLDDGQAAAGSKGKRKLQASISPVPHNDALSAAQQAAAAAKKRRKDEQQQPIPVGGPYPQQVSHSYVPNSTSSANIAGQPIASSSYNYQQQLPPTAVGGSWAATSSRQADLAAPVAGSSYRGGYPSGTGALTNGHALPPARPQQPVQADRQQIVESAAAAQKRLMYERSLQDGYRPEPQRPLSPIDDRDGHYIVRAGEWIVDPRIGQSRYKILSLLGQGTFGKVIECWDRVDQRHVAIKVIRAVQKYRDASQIEIRVLRALSVRDPRNVNKCIHLLDTFSYRNHVCIVSELLGKSVFDFLKDNNFQPFPPAHIWSFAKQLLKSVAFIQSMNLVHTDLKPENILLVQSDFDYVPTSKRANAKRKRVLKDTDIRLIDFGSATFNDEYHSQVVSTRHYRAPEIILNMGWSFPCDAWSIGCILIEFYTGEALFQTHDNLEHLAMMEQVLGPMPTNFRRKAETFKAEYFRGGRLDFPNEETPKNSKKYVAGMRKLGEIVSRANAWKKHNERFLALLRRLLEFDPAKRIPVAEALQHPYFDLTASEIPP